MPIDPYFELAHGVLDDATVDLDEVPRLEAELRDAVQSGREHPAQVRAYALRLWAFEAGRNPRRVVELLKERADYEVEAVTIRKWALVDDWDQKSADLHQIFITQSRAAIEAQILQGAVRAVGVLAEIMVDTGGHTNARVKAASQMLGVAGYVPVPTQTSTLNVAVNIGNERLSNATDEELQDIIDAYGTDNAHDAPPHEATYREVALHHRQQQRDHTRASDAGLTPNP